jgi:hypothetical protein
MLAIHVVVIGLGKIFIDLEVILRKKSIRYVNCPVRQEDENLAAVQFNGELYYQTLRDVKAGEEVEELSIV